ncbi:MAG: hypothetical protein JWM09_977 [Francisellaceae bacterium]|nr:hypothetical protein [Francisellaceae bacterium]
MPESSNKLSTHKEEVFKYYTVLAIGFVSLLLTANIIGEKPIQIGSIILPAGLLIFPLTYLLGDAITEVYGFALSRKVIWGALIANLFMALACQLAISLPHASYWHKQEAYQTIFGMTARLMMVSVFTYFIGEFMNTLIISKLKIYMRGRNFWLRALCSSAVGELIETSLFIPLAFWGSMGRTEMIKLMGFFYNFKVLYALLAMPLLSILVKFLKKAEQLDSYDYQTNYSPLKF